MQHPDSEELKVNCHEILYNRNVSIQSCERPVTTSGYPCDASLNKIFVEQWKTLDDAKTTRKHACMIVIFKLLLGPLLLCFYSSLSFSCCWTRGFVVVKTMKLQADRMHWSCNQTCISVTCQSNWFYDVGHVHWLDRNLWTGCTGHLSKSQDHLFGIIKHLLDSSAPDMENV